MEENESIAVVQREREALLCDLDNPNEYGVDALRASLKLLHLLYRVPQLIRKHFWAHCLHGDMFGADSNRHHHSTRAIAHAMLRRRFEDSPCTIQDVAEERQRLSHLVWFPERIVATFLVIIEDMQADESEFTALAKIVRSNYEHAVRTRSPYVVRPPDRPRRRRYRPP